MILKNQLQIVFIFLFTNILFSQTDFEKGVFITNTEENVECFIKNLDWKNNPTEFKYKLSIEGEIKTVNIETIKVFEVYGKSKYVRASVNIDRSSSNMNNLSENKKPIFKKEQLFLKVIVTGNATLYKYEDGNLQRFFYSVTDNEIEQLVYKEYLFDTNRIGKNNHYKQQILNALKCEQISIKTIENLEYNIKKLSSFFEKYNNCIGGEDIVNYEKKNKRDLFNFRAKLGFGSASLSIDNRLSPSSNTDFDNEFIYRIGGELEMILPFNNNKWAIVIEHSYQSFTSTKYRANTFVSSDDIGIKAKYSTIEIPVGVRYYLFLNDDSKIFVNAFYSLVFINDAKIEFTNSTKSNLEMEKGAGKSIGVGYNYRKLSLECRYDFSREILRQYKYWRSDYNQVSLILGYQFF